MPEWNELFLEEKNRWKDPHEKVVAIAAEWKQQGFNKILDLGCGAGRHLILLAGEGFESYGLDNSENALQFSRHNLNEKGLTADLKFSDMTRLPYDNATFDGLISTYVIHHQTLAGMMQTMSEIYRVMKVNGEIFITLQSIYGHRFKNGFQVEHNTFIPELGEDAGIPHHFCDLMEVSILLQNFKVMSVEQNEHYNEVGYKSAHWFIHAVKIPLEK
jgi:cyclopropane fatty-acyl-phospholipid synthase-like methyltransferase